ncbi:hypothetical protein AHAS_Ahas19G0281200 [Arachis hypogaea]|uniref:PGG domain-containing protein n=1 Tax=Arachis hypogaea TaxID=3818 RepID=A0A444XS23_ARAHY|nr:hypothetical protein Ahy_B09g098747 [Arachis hypogaea]
MDNQQHSDCDKDIPNPSHSHARKISDGITSSNQGLTSFIREYRPLHEALRKGDLAETEKYLIKDHPGSLCAKITSNHETALHIAIMFGHLDLAKRLVELMSEEDLALKSRNGTTALHLVTLLIENEDEIIDVAKCMVEKNKRLVTLSDTNDWLPVTLALDLGHTEMARYLYSQTPFEFFQPRLGKHGVVLLVQCYYTNLFDIALDLIDRCPKLVVTDGRRGLNFLEMLANMPSELLLRKNVPFWKRWLNPRSQLQVLVEKIPGSAQKTKRDDFGTNASSGIKKAKAVENDKQFPLQAAFSAIYKLNEREITAGRIREAILKAAKRGNPEFIVEAIRIHYPFLWNTNDENGRNIFFLAVEFRQAAVLNLIHGLAMKHVFANMRDKGANCLLHMAGLPPPSSHLNRISGALLQMQREMQWFKEVESIIPHMKKEYLNRENKTPRDLFTENHRELLKQGEKWTKANAGSCSVVAALVATITFAAAFTVPGGNDQIKGYPIFLHKSLFVLFMISNATSLFSSTTSLLIFLALLNSRYAEDDFLKSLPSKMIIGLSTMLFSLANMMLAFCAALFLTLKSQAWIVIPVTFLGCVPVIFYIWLQFPLLIEIIMSTYGPGIFNRNVKRWP